FVLPILQHAAECVMRGIAVPAAGSGAGSAETVLAQSGIDENLRTPKTQRASLMETNPLTEPGINYEAPPAVNAADVDTVPVPKPEPQREPVRNLFAELGLAPDMLKA